MALFREMYARFFQGANRRLCTFAGGRWAKFCRPGSIAILLTERCNARCVHCDIWKNLGAEERPTLDQWKAVLHNLRKWLGPVQVTITGGEALLVPYAADLVAYGSSIGLMIEHLTNGYWPKQERVEQLAAAKPWRVTISVDGIGQTHDRIRGREGFFEAVTRTIATVQRVWGQLSYHGRIRLKTVIMEHNLGSVADVAGFAKEHGLEVFYQPIEQNYSTPEDSRWFEHSDNWPRDAEQAVAAVEKLIRLKRQDYPIANDDEQLQVMIPYFRDPDAWRVLVQDHRAKGKETCSAMTTLQIQASGDVKTCWKMDPIGNIKVARIRAIWRRRPRYWEGGCCLERRMSAAEKDRLSLSVSQTAEQGAA
jgi:MoaA/NifB/PqqE/SkfB family radical SAM enzyme